MSKEASTCEISMERFRNSIRLRWRFSKVRFSLTVGHFSKSTIQEAEQLITIIGTDIDNGKFDFSLKKYEALLKKNQPVLGMDQHVVATEEKKSATAVKSVEQYEKLQVSKKPNESTVSVFFQEWMETLKPVPS